MAEWVGRRLDLWMSGWLDGSVNGRVGGWKTESVDGVARWEGGWRAGLVGQEMESGLVEFMDGRVSRVDGGLSGWVDICRAGCVVSLIIVYE